ncbi:MAG: methyltransferase [Rhodospirillales bacterium]|nr:methyltransferase [Rhodospirillales bacterium]
MQTELDRFLGIAPPATPPCRHAGSCGGCAVQQVEAGAVAAWKRERIVDALRRVGLTAEIEPTATVAPATRRRATLAALRQGKHVMLGFNERKSDRIVDLRGCEVLTPKLVALLAPLRTLVGTLLQQRESADLALTEAGNGIELVLVRKRALALADLEALAEFAETHDLARVAWRSTVRSPVEPVAVRRVPMILLGGVRVSLPPASFLQPTLDGETMLIERVLATLPGAKRVADLFCGVGTFALPLAATGAAVTAFDSDKDAVGALAATRKVQAVTRDLFREPLSVKELRDFDKAVLDPARAGAAAQVATLAEADFERLTYVSCNPTTFARDARVLVEGGWKLHDVLPVDQFRWSTHVELVARLERR